MIIALTGPKGSGKTAIAQRLVATHSFTRLSFADPIKAMLAAIGIEARFLYGDAKEHPHPLLCGQTARLAMQTLGTEWGRLMIHEELWTNHWKTRVLAALAESVPVVCDDLRYKNEAAIVTSLGGVVVYVERPGVNPRQDTHRSEMEILDIPSDTSIVNDGASLNDLYAEVDRFMQEQGGEQ